MCILAIIKGSESIFWLPPAGIHEHDPCKYFHYHSLISVSPMLDINKTELVKAKYYLWTVLSSSSKIREYLTWINIKTEIIRGTCIENGKVKNFNILTRTGKCTPCLPGTRTLCCIQVLTTSTFMSQQSQHLTFSLTLTVKVNMLFI